jgi:NTE family protein
VTDAVRASIARPGLFTPALYDGNWLVDGGLVNPVPVSLCRAMGADLVIAVDLNADLLGRHLKSRPAKDRPRERTPAEPETLTDSVMARIQDGMSQLGLNHDSVPKPPAMLDVLASSINIMQVLITRSRLAGEPADVMVTPLLADLGLMEFHKGDVAIDAGRRAVEGAMPQLQRRLNG